MDFQQARFNMIERQIKPWSVHDRTILELLSKIHRENFMPNNAKNLALADMSLALTNDQITMPPKLEARLLQALKIKAEDNILEVGTGCAYLTALLAALGDHVLSIDICSEFLHQAQAKFKQYDIQNTTLEHGNAAYGWQQFAPYDVIVLTGSIPFLEISLKKQLTINGRLFVISGTSPVMEARLVERISQHKWHDTVLFETDFPALKGIKPVQSFKF